MVKHTQTFRRQKLTNCLSAFEHFVGLALKELAFQKQSFKSYKKRCSGNSKTSMMESIFFFAKLLLFQLFQDDTSLFDDVTILFKVNEIMYFYE